LTLADGVNVGVFDGVIVGVGVGLTHIHGEIGYQFVSSESLVVILSFLTQ